MTVFKTFLKIVNKYKGTIILYTMMLLVFGVTNLNTKETTSFIETKPDVVIIDEDNSKLSNSLVNYMKKKTNYYYIYLSLLLKLVQSINSFR